MKVLVTGGRGFIGTRLVRELIQLGHDVVVIDNLSSIVLPKNDGAEYIIADVRDYDAICGEFQGVECVFHLAAEARIQASIDNPKYAADVNITGTVNVLEACRVNNVPRIVNSSTSAIYGLTDQFPTSESVESDCLNPYSATKLAAEEMVRCYSKMYGIESISLRYFNVFGEDSPVSGPYSLVVGLFLSQRDSGESLTVVGKGESLRDFVYVGDVAKANIKAMSCEIDSLAILLNIGSGHNISVIEVARAISDDIVFVPPRPGESKQTLADVSRAKEVLDWEPTTTLIEWLQKSSH